MSADAVTLSVVSHGQNALVAQLLADLAAHCAPGLRIIVTLNVPGDPPPAHGAKVELVENSEPAGFGANHNAAFRRCTTEYFCVCNPDIRLHEDPFPALVHALQIEGAGVAGPLVRGPDGAAEDSARHFPKLGTLVRKLLHGASGPEYPTDRGIQRVDWVAGMFMLFRRRAFEAAGGFDERFFLYYEDVDICRRLRRLGFACLYQPAASVVHEARRASRRNPRLMAIHAASIARYLIRRYK